MDARNRLWTELIFPLCEPVALLALRAVCRGFRDQLVALPTRCWLPLTMCNTRMCYAERVLGWPGVLRAMERERITLANCEAGRFVRGPSFRLREGRLLFAGGRIVCFEKGVVRLYDYTSSVVATLSTGVAVAFPYAIQDRWIALSDDDNSACLLDCVAACIVPVKSAVSATSVVPHSVAGSCVAFRDKRGAGMSVFRASAGPNNATVVREVAHVSLQNIFFDQFALCEKGLSFLESRDKQLRLVDLETRQLKRVFAPPDGLYIDSCNFLAHSDFVITSLRPLASMSTFSVVVHRISDGHASALVPSLDITLSVGGRVSCRGPLIYDVFDAVTGAPMSLGSSRDMVFDTSGAFAWRDRPVIAAHALTTSSGATASGHALPIADSPARIVGFHYGVLFGRHEDGSLYVLRFDIGEGDAPSETQSATTGLMARAIRWLKGGETGK